MKVQMELDEERPTPEPLTPGNTYKVRGGRGAALGHRMILMAVTEDRYVLLLIVDKHGQPVNVTRYYDSYLEELVPTAFTEGFEDLTLVMRNL